MLHVGRVPTKGHPPTSAQPTRTRQLSKKSEKPLSVRAVGRPVVKCAGLFSRFFLPLQVMTPQLY